MGLLSYLRGDNLIESRASAADAESRSLPPAENQLPLMSAYTGQPVNTTTALQIADVWAATRVLCDAASSLPLHVYRKTDDGRQRVDAGSLAELLEAPGPGVTQADLTSSLMSHLLIWGNGYLAKFREAGNITQLGLLHPDRVRPELQGGELRFRYQPPDIGPEQLLTTADVVHVKGLSVDGLTGLSAVSQAARVLGLSDELVKHALSYFDTDAAGGSGRPAGVLRLGQGAPVEELERTHEWLRAKAARGGAHNVLVIEGEADYTPMTAPLDDAQFVEQRRLAAQEIARVFRIPPAMLGAPTGDSLTYSTVEQQSLDFTRYSLAPWLRRVELALSGDRDLAFREQFVKFELDGLLRGDSRTRAEVYRLALDPVQGWMTRDEVRRLEDLPPGAAAPPVPTVEAMLAAATNGNPDNAEVG